jgi:hypothetical protein
VKKIIFLFVFFNIIISGCATPSPERVAELKKIKELTDRDKRYAIKTLDKRAEIVVEAHEKMDIDGVSIEPSRIIASALDKSLPQISSNFTSPDAIPNSKRHESEWPVYLFSVVYSRTGQKLITTSAMTTSDVAWWEKNGKTQAFRSQTYINFDCTGDTSKVCSKKFENAAIDAVFPYIKKFLDSIYY